jgi:hypothetical protein
MFREGRAGRPNLQLDQQTEKLVETIRSSVSFFCLKAKNHVGLIFPAIQIWGRD